jgi:tripeptide aminopeptidase
MYPINEQRLLSTFLELVSIPSPSWKEHQVISYIEKRLSSLNIPLKKYPCNGSYNILATLEGDSARQPIMLSGHMDTVVPCEKINPVAGKTRITSDGTSILGSDDKAAIAMFLEAFEVIKEKKLPHGTVELLLSCAEEVGLHGIKCFDTSVIRSKIGFVFDCGGHVGSMILKAPYQCSMEIRIRGRAAHAGMEPEKGISAIVVLSSIISRIPSGRIDHETTTNVGLLSGGKATNIVAEDAWCRLEIRSIDRKKMNAVEAKVRKVVKEVCGSSGAKAAIVRNLEYPGFILKETDPIVRMADRAMAAIRIKPRHEISGGGSDTNIFNKSGIKAMNLACGMQKVHTTREFITKKDLIDGARLTLALIEEA